MTIKLPIKKAGNLELPILGLGTWQMGGRFRKNPFNNDKRDINAIKGAINLGLFHIDTAEVYANGHAERLIAKAIKDIPREKIFITSKVDSDHLRYDDVIKACQGSLQRLGIKKLDLYLIHGPNQSYPLKETMGAMDYLLENELTSYIGVSNFHVPLLQEAQSYTKYKIVNNQIHYNLAARAYEENGTLKYCAEHDILVTAYSPIAKAESWFVKNVLLQKMSEKYSKTPIQTALNWVINKPNIVALVKSSNIEHLKEDLGAMGWRLKSEDERELDEKFPKGETMFVP